MVFVNQRRAYFYGITLKPNRKFRKTFSKFENEEFMNLYTKYKKNSKCVFVEYHI